MTSYFTFSFVFNPRRSELKRENITRKGKTVLKLDLNVDEKKGPYPLFKCLSTRRARCHNCANETDFVRCFSLYILARGRRNLVQKDKNRE